MKQDYYKILGVIDTAELAVIKAAYKALMQIYHPDRYEGDKEKAHIISQEINEAYRVLSNPDLRKAYDLERESQKNQYTPDNDDEETEENNLKDAVLNANWEIARQYVTNLESLYQSLHSLSPELSFTFKLELLETKRFNEAGAISEVLKTGFLTKYFGENKEIQHFAFWLLLNKQRQIAQELNKVVTVLGENFNGQEIIDKLKIKHNLPYKTKWETQKTKNQDKQEQQYQEAQKKNTEEVPEAILWGCMPILIFISVAYLLFVLVVAK